MTQLFTGTRRKRTRSVYARLLFVGGLLWFISIFHTFASKSQYINTGEGSYFSRHLLSTSEWESCDYETQYMRNESDPDNKHTTPDSAYGWMILHILCIIIIFIAVAIVCDDFFVPSLEAISEKLDLSEDVAGATFMAAGSSAPELFTSVAGVTNESDVGVGTIVGSAVFNLLVIIALTAALTTQTLQLDWRPLFRDSVCYALSIVVFIIFSWDSKFEFYESMILLILYFLYIMLMKYNVQLMNILEKWKQKRGRVSPEVHDIADTVAVEINQEPETTTEDNPETMPHVKLAPLKIDFDKDVKSDACSHHSFVTGQGALPHFTHSHKGELSSHFTRRKSSVLPHEMVKIKSIAAGHIAKEMNRHSTAEKLNVVETREGEIGVPCEVTEEPGEEDDAIEIKIIPFLPAVSISLPEKGEGNIIIVYIRYVLDWCLFFPAFPFVCLFTWTIPDCSTVHTRKYFLASFFASILWIAILSFGMVTLVGRVGCILNVDKFTMGLVVIAIGTSIPDALSSIIVARDGYGDMAVSNAIGSNVFDIDLGIGLPFVIKGIIQNLDPIYLLNKRDQELYDNDEMAMVPHAKFGFILLLILFVCIGVFAFVKFRLGRIVGASFFLLYIFFVTYAYLQDLLCDHDC